MESKCRKCKQPRKKWLARERQIKAREQKVTSREANQNKRDEQTMLLKTHVNKLELHITDVG